MWTGGNASGVGGRGRGRGRYSGCLGIRGPMGEWWGIGGMVGDGGLVGT